MTSTFSHCDKTSSDHIVGSGPALLNSVTSQYTAYRPVVPYTTMRVSELSHVTASSGVQSQIGARWKEDFTNTMNSGFASGTPRTERRKGVREGRESVDGMPREKGVGRTGKGPAAVPLAMIRAARGKKDRPKVESTSAYEIDAAEVDEDEFCEKTGAWVWGGGSYEEKTEEEKDAVIKSFARRRRDGKVVVYEGVGRGPAAGEVKKKSKSKGESISLGLIEH